jgi:hypothetical protein
VEREQPRIDVQHPRCPYCKDELHPGQKKAACEDCMAWHHLECWEAHGGCATCGRSRLSTGTGAESETPARVEQVEAPDRSYEPRCTFFDCVEAGTEQAHFNLYGRRLCRRHYLLLNKIRGVAFALVTLFLLVAAGGLLNRSSRLYAVAGILIAVGVLTATFSFLFLLAARKGDGEP